ncbi:MAG: hypothetical protein IT256_02055 [Chitinophagaceae bacterium]|nr:hypothetical protein [Chitinophagaceae bacterium]
MTDFFNGLSLLPHLKSDAAFLVFTVQLFWGLDLVSRTTLGFQKNYPNFKSNNNLPRYEIQGLNVPPIYIFMGYAGYGAGTQLSED